MAKEFLGTDDRFSSRELGQKAILYLIDTSSADCVRSNSVWPAGEEEYQKIWQRNLYNSLSHAQSNVNKFIGFCENICKIILNMIFQG